MGSRRVEDGEIKLAVSIEVSHDDGLGIRTNGVGGWRSKLNRRARSNRAQRYQESNYQASA